ncbi:MAG: cbb3-type cytochrome c oxidase subunit I [Eubacteriales bacterium]|nr:cbb3-type cytochrome c oxidase subunit I [Eubacteriales bacterium]
MKPYLESVRRLSRVALILFVLTFVASLIMAMQYCMRSYVSSIPSFSQMFLPVIIYMFAGGFILALDGFFFLNKRADSDYYHSLPVSRKRLFWSVTLAALTWLAATVLASVIVILGVYTITHTAFVPNYGLLAAPFCIAGGMLVFAAASIGISITGTWISNIALTLIVLGLPRFIQFVVSRGILARFGMMGWLDLPWYLTPVTNVATGQIVTFTHNLLQTQLYSMVNAGYSILLAALELLVACMLFVRRPSELAEHNARSANIQTLYACLLAFPIAILFTSGAISPTLINVLIVTAVTIALYAIYQIVVLRNSKRVLHTLPWALVPAALAVAMFFGIQIPVNAAKNDIPLIQDVAYVQFPGSNRTSGNRSYDEYLVSQIKFTDQDLKDYVLTSLRDNVATIDRYGNVNYRTEENYTTLEPVSIVLNNGHKIKRFLWFSSSNTLNTLRNENEEYAKAIRALPPEDSIRYQQGFDVYDAKYQTVEPIVQAYYSDIETTGLIPNWSYNQHSETEDYSAEGKQSFGSLTLAGYVGNQRYYDNYDIRRETQNASKAWMTWQNSQSTDEYFDVLKQISAQASSFLSKSDSLNCTFSFYNVPMSSGVRQYNEFYYGRNPMDTTILNSSFEPYANELIDIISRSEPTTDPNSFCVFMTWSGRAIDKDGSYIGEDVIKKQATSGNSLSTASNMLLSSWGDVVYYTSGGNPGYYSNDGTVVSFNPCYRAFSAEDEARVIEILKDWKALQKELQFNYSDVESEDTIIGSSALPAPTPTPVP